MGKASLEVDGLLDLVRRRHRVWLVAHEGYGKTWDKVKAENDYSILSMRCKLLAEKLFPSMTEACAEGELRVERIIAELRARRDDKRRPAKEIG